VVSREPPEVPENAATIASTSAEAATTTTADEFSGTSSRISSKPGPFSLGM
jgi:hypothetical protein